MCGLVVPIALAHAGCIVLCVFTVCRDTWLIMVDHGVEIVAGIVPILHGVDGRGAAISSQVTEMWKSSSLWRQPAPAVAPDVQSATLFAALEDDNEPWWLWWSMCLEDKNKVEVWDAIVKREGHRNLDWFLCCKKYLHFMCVVCMCLGVFWFTWHVLSCVVLSVVFSILWLNVSKWNHEI